MSLTTLYLCNEVRKTGNGSEKITSSGKEQKCISLEWKLVSTPSTFGPLSQVCLNNINNGSFFSLQASHIAIAVLAYKSVIKITTSKKLMQVNAS